MTQTCPSAYRLPDLHSLCPWVASFNPHHAEVAAASARWTLRYVGDIINDTARLAHFDQGYTELLCAWVYPYASADTLRVCCDLINLVYAVDELSDEQSGEDARSTVETLLHTFQEPTYNDGSVLCRMAIDVRDRFLPFAGQATAQRFLSHLETYAQAVAVEADLRNQNVTLDLVSYNTYRRENSATRLCLDLIGYVIGLDLPDAVFEHPAFLDMHFAVTDMVNWSNDLYSFNREQAMGHHNSNVLTVLQVERGMSLQGASDYVGVHFKELVDTFETCKAHLPSFGKEVDEVVTKYIKGMECWAIGNIEWSFAIGRYFGNEHKAVRDSLIVQLYPRQQVLSAAL